MADITKRAGAGVDCGERGERGKRGHRGPDGPATSLVGPTSGPAALIADEDIPAGFVIAAGGSAVLAVGDLDKYCTDHPGDIAKCKNCTIDPFSVPPNQAHCPKKAVIGVASVFTRAGQVVNYVAAGPLVLPATTWDTATGGSGGLIPNAIYYLSADEPGHLTPNKPSTGQIVKIGVAFEAEVLDVQIENEDEDATDGLTIIGNGIIPLSAVGYGFGSGRDFEGSSSSYWELAPTGTLPGTPIFRNPTSSIGQGPASATAWLSSHVIGLSKPGGPNSGGVQGIFISGGIFELTEDQWNAVWTAADPNRGIGSGLLPGYPYYLSDVPGTFFLIDKTGAPPVAPGNWITRCFVALSSTYALILLSDPRQAGTPPAPSDFLPIVYVVNPIFNGDFNVAAGFFNAVVAAASLDGNAVLPAAISVPNGTPIAIGNYPGLDGNESRAINLKPQAGDTINHQTASPNTTFQIDNDAAWLLLVSDGISNWQPLSFQT